MARFDRHEIIVSTTMLGEGSFSYVFPVKSIDLLQQHSKYADATQRKSRRRLAKHARQTPNRYAVKFLRSVEQLGPNRYCQAALDIMVEAKLLASLDHPNIVTLHGAACGNDGCGFSALDGSIGSFFLLLDQLDGTLKEKLPIWREQQMQQQMQQQPQQRNITTTTDTTTSQSISSWPKRLKVAAELASALSYLHSRNIVYRDVKPSNVGFDFDGTVRLIDLGLATELDESKRHLHTSTYDMSGNTGSRLYMPPEVILRKPYNLTADVFSFSIVLWQICALRERPYRCNCDGDSEDNNNSNNNGHATNMSQNEYVSRVAIGGERPMITNKEWPLELERLLIAGWNDDIRERPCMAKVHQVLSLLLEQQPQQQSRSAISLTNRTVKSARTDRNIVQDDAGSQPKSSAAAEREEVVVPESPKR